MNKLEQENLLVPELIGPECKYANLADFITKRLGTKLQREFDNIKKECKEYSDKNVRKVKYELQNDVRDTKEKFKGDLEQLETKLNDFKKKFEIDNVKRF